jgi:CHASE1-domain containing sensor protein
MDINVSVNFKASEINGLFQELEELKKQRANLKDEIEKKMDTIVRHIEKNGNVLAYKNNVAHVLSVKARTTKKFDKSQLATDTGRSSSELNLIGVAELVEEKKTSSEQLKKYRHDEMKVVLKARKAKKSDIDLLGSRAL